MQPTPNRYFHWTARLLHWLMAAGMLLMLAFGSAMVSSLAYRPWLLHWHQSLGLLLWLLAWLRLANRRWHPPPALPADLPSWQCWAAKISHVWLYLCMLALPIIGWGMQSAAGYPVVLLPGWTLPALLPVSPAWYAWLRSTHSWLAWLFGLALLLHLSAALTHGWIRRDQVLASMLRGAGSDNRLG